MEKTVITSLQNDKIKHIVLLQQKSSERKRTGLFVVEGQRELMHCMDAGYEVESIFWCKSLAPDFRPQINTVEKELVLDAQGAYQVYDRFFALWLKRK